MLIYACNYNNEVIICDDEQNLNEWSKQASIPNHLRLGAAVVTYNNQAYLMPGRGGYRFGIEPEILRYSNDTWTEIAIYDGWAKAGSYGIWQIDDLVYLAGGINGSSHPTNEVVTFSLSNNDLNVETYIPYSRRRSVCSCNSRTKGYIGYGHVVSDPFNNLQHDIWSYDFATGHWDSIPKPSINHSIHYSLMTCENDHLYLLIPTLESNNFYCLKEGSKKWVKLSDFPGNTRSGSVIISNASDIYTGLGSAISEDRSIYSDIWKYNIQKNEWISFCQYPGVPFHSGFAFELNNDLFFGGGSNKFAISMKSLNNELYRLRITENNKH